VSTHETTPISAFGIVCYTTHDIMKLRRWKFFSKAMWDSAGVRPRFWVVMEVLKLICRVLISFQSGVWHNLMHIEPPEHISMALPKSKFIYFTFQVSVSLKSPLGALAYVCPSRSLRALFSRSLFIKLSRTGLNRTYTATREGWFLYSYTAAESDSFAFVIVTDNQGQ